MSLSHTLAVFEALDSPVCRFHDEAEFARLVALYGDMRRLQGTAR